MQRVQVAGAVIINDKKQILCALRSATMSQAGLWEFPGGKLELGENPRDCLVRELREELNCTVEVGDKITCTNFEYPSVAVCLTTYFAQVVEGKPIPLEHEKLVWLEVSELPALKWAPADIPTVEALSSSVVDKVFTATLKQNGNIVPFCRELTR